jgi:hypothetical protein
MLLAAFAALTVAMIWPLVSPRFDVLPDSDDAYFSAWRLAWVAHQLPSDPRHLFDANVFHPATGTFAFSDAMLLVSIAGAPLLWAGAPLSVVHNLLIAAAFVSSMWFAFLLIRDLTGSAGAAWIGSLVFGFAPYRLAHIGHLELQWVMWMPLSVWLLHRFFAAPAPGRAIAVGAAVAGQTFCSIYYGIFLSWYLAVAWVILFAIHTPVRRRAAALSALMLVPLIAVLIVYGPPYAQTRAEQGPRRPAEVTEFSARPADFLRVPPHNKFRGQPHDPGPAPDERSLYPGTVALLFAAAAFARPGRKWPLVYAALTAVSVDATLGMNGLLLPAIQDVVPIVTSLRSPVRFGALLLLSVSVLAGFGAALVFAARPRWTPAILAVATVLCLAEYWSVPVRVRPGRNLPTEAHRSLAYQPAGTVILELPVPKPEALWLYESTYQLQSVHHWQPLVNGYSGFAPREYVRTLESLRGFPDAVAVQRLRQLQVKFVLLNRVYYSGDEFAALISAIDASQSFWPPQSMGNGDDQIVIVELKTSEAPPR